MTTGLQVGERRVRPAARGLPPRATRAGAALGGLFAAGAALCQDEASLRRARDHGSALAAGGDTHAAFAAVTAFAGDVLAHVASEPEWPDAEARRLVRMAAGAAGAPEPLVRTAVCSRALREPRLHELPPRLAAEAVLRLLENLAPVQNAELWLAAGPGRLRRVLGEGAGETADRLRVAAERALEEGETVELEGAVAVPVLRWQRPTAVLSVLPLSPGTGDVRVLGEDAAAALALVLEREALLERGLERERSLVEASERRLARVAFDIHDGAIQDVLALAADVRLLRSQLAEVVPAGRTRARTTGRLDDLHARLAAVEADLRDVTNTVAPPAIARRAVDEALGEQLAALGGRYGLETRLDVSGDVSGLTPSQRIALVRIVQEAVNNAHEHGRAHSVEVTVRAERDGLHARVTDDGCGFDVERTLGEAARRSRMGLVGIAERVRLLGGRFDLDSRPGGPTVLIVSFPPWRPLDEARTATGEERREVAVEARPGATLRVL